MMFSGRGWTPLICPLRLGYGSHSGVAIHYITEEMKILWFGELMVMMLFLPLLILFFFYLHLHERRHQQENKMTRGKEKKRKREKEKHDNLAICTGRRLHTRTMGSVLCQFSSMFIVIALMRGNLVVKLFVMT